MARNRQEVHQRLQQAALELFRERGYDHTTAAEIAAHAGVTERTFFRHFADKRDILFGGEEAIQIALTAALADAPADFTPLQALQHAFRAVCGMFEENRAFSEPRQQVIAATPALREREAGKMASIMAALVLTLEQRGVEPRLATLVVQVGAAAFSYALAAWLADASEDLNTHLERAFERLRALSVADERTGPPHVP